ELALEYEQGSFFIRYYQTRLPVALSAYAYILSAMIERLKAELDESHTDIMELQSIMTAIGYLPPRTENDEEKLRERYREKEIVKRRLDRLVEESGAASGSLQSVLMGFNGERGNPRSFDRLEQILD